MELDDFKATWTKEQKELEDRLVINEDLLRQMTADNSKSKFSKHLKVSILGRNLAIVYMLMSMFFAYLIIEEYQYSIPAIVGGLAMLFSFMQHQSLKHPDFSNMTTLELQKTISKFRIHTSNFSKYDILILLFWYITIIPAILKGSFNISVYDNWKNISVFLFGILVLILGTLLFSKKIYKKIDSELAESTKQLESISQFEQN
jgi:hypothetical protein